VTDCGAGTLVLLPAGRDGATGSSYDAAVAAGVATNRLLPDLVLALDVVPDAPAGGRVVGADGQDPWLVAEAARRLPAGVMAESGAEERHDGTTGDGAMAAGAAAAARAHNRPFLALEVPAVGDLTAAVPALLASELR
jgi:hypothetical protein